MILDSFTIAVPMRVDEHGTIRVSGTRVTLDTVIARYRQGGTPETIHTAFDVLTLNDIYAVIAYYLAHHEELDAYLEQRASESERLRQQVEAHCTPEQEGFNERIRQQIEENRQRNS
jgi:uncharacterized protein (DUF433 family)